MGTQGIQRELEARIAYLERQLASRPTFEQVQWVKDYADRRERLYNAVLARNEVLARKLREWNPQGSEAARLSWTERTHEPPPSKEECK